MHRLSFCSTATTKWKHSVTTRSGEDFGGTAILTLEEFGETAILMLENSGGMKGNRIFAPEIKLLASMKRVYPDMTLSCVI